MTEIERREYMKRYNIEHKEELAEKRRKYYEANKDKYRAASRRYYTNHKETVRMRVAVSRERKAMGMMETPESPELAADIRKRIFGDHAEEIKNAKIFETPESPQLSKDLRNKINKKNEERQGADNNECERD